MALTLDPTLAAAQNNQSRNPIVSLISTSSRAEIPFLGKFLDTVGTAERNPNVITHSSGALAGVMRYGDNFRFFYTDPNRTEFAFLDITPPHYGIEANLVELADGNIGLILLLQDGTYYYFYRMVVSPTGAVITSPTSIFSVAFASYVLSGVALTRLANGTYLLVYSKETVSGATYGLEKRTSSNFVTWSAEGDLSIGGLTDTKRISNPSLLQISTGDIWLWFDYLESTSGTNELTNIYYSTSADNGATWASATKFTNYSTYDTVGRHPITAQKVADQMTLLFTEVKGVIKMDSTQAGYCAGGAFNAGYLQFDSVGRKLYVGVHSGSGFGGGWGIFQGIVRVDVDTWSIDACWSGSTIPALPSWAIGSGGVSPFCWHGEENLVAISTEYYQSPSIQVMVLDGDADSVTPFSFTDDIANGITRNVNWNNDLAYWMGKTWLDKTNNRLYCFFYCGNPNCTVYVGYLDLTEAAPGPGEYYTFHDVFKHTIIGVQQALFEDGQPGMAVFPEADYIVILAGSGVWTGAHSSSYNGQTLVFQISTGLLLKTYSNALNPQYPTHGIANCVYRTGKLWCFYMFDSDTYPDSWPGMCDIDLATDIITHHKPTWDPITGSQSYWHYYFDAMLMTPDQSTLIFNQRMLGMAVYDITSDTWTLHTNNDIPGLDPNLGTDLYWTWSMAYDPTTEMVYYGLAGRGWDGVVGFCMQGLINQTVYQTGTFTTDWAWGTAAPLIEGLQNSEAVVALEPGTESIYSFWTEKVFPSGNTRIKWDKESAELELADYLLKGTDISVHRSIDGSPAGLDFQVSSGHLFDPNNVSSLMSIYLEKGRMLVLKFGENISGIDYWQDQGSFFVVDTKLSYRRGTYPSMTVSAKDRKVFFEQGLIQVSDYYQDYPEPVLQDILKAAFDLIDADFDLPTFDDREIIYQQWIETQAKDIIDQICNRFGYFLRMTVEDLVSARKISNANTVDHVYSNLTKIIDFTPDDSFSDFTNQVIAIGHSLIDIPVVYPEERIQTLNGTCGWWGFKKDFNVYYSLDGSKKCQNPRLAILESTQSIMFQFAGQVHESISYIDPNGLYCVVTVTAPDLTPLLMSTVVGWAAAHAIPDGWGGFIVGGVTIPVGRILEGIAMVATMMILASVGNFQYEVWAHPLGNVRRTVQYISDDTDLQAKINSVITKKFEEPLAYTETMCKVCADHELMVFQAQRKRVTFSKVAYLQDEEGDTLQLPHPYSGSAVKVFVTEITRKMKIPEASGGEGYFEDEIQGWNVT
jgi:hypothetical protein